ncbi:MAG: AAA family ATPase [Eubacteriales bacterium]|nr:AAA family ATPase [Eubacteriales bacterium]
MKLKRLSIGSFGIMRNQTLEDLNPGVVVVGGMNRAGKSTFMEILRNLVWGFPRNCSYPSHYGKYEVSCDIITDSGEMYTSRLTGYAEPEVFGPALKSGKVPSLQELYNIDRFTYKNIFTIDLSQLQKIPGGLNGKEEADKLQSILLGAGLSDYVRIPRIVSEFQKEYGNIGGKNGSPNVKMFAPYYSSIEDGLKQRKEAGEQVDRYFEKKRELWNLDKLIKDKEKVSISLRAEIALLDVLKSNFEVYNERKEKELALEVHRGAPLHPGFPLVSFENAKSAEKEYLSLLAEHEEKTEAFRSITGADDIKSIRNTVSKNENKLKRFFINTSGLRERIFALKSAISDNEKLRDEIIQKMKRVNFDWGENDWEIIKKIPIDMAEEKRFNKTIEDYINKGARVKSVDENLNMLRAQRITLEEGIKAQRTMDLQKPFNMIIYWIVLFAIAGIALFFVDPLLGVIPFSAGITGVLAFFTYKMFTSKRHRERMSDLEKQLLEVNSNIKQKEEERAVLNNEIKACSMDLDGWRNTLGLNESDSVEMLKVSFIALCDIQDKMFSWERHRESIRDTSLRINEELNEYYVVLTELGTGGGFNSGHCGDLIPASEQLFREVEKWHSRIKLVEELNWVEQKIALQVEKVRQLMGSWSDNEPEGTAIKDVIHSFIEKGEAVKDYLQLKSEMETAEKRMLHGFNTNQAREAFSFVEGFEADQSVKAGDIEKLYSEYRSISGIETKYQQQVHEAKNIEGEIESAKNNRQSCRDEIKRLSTTENLEKAQRKIDEARGELKPLAKKYAIYSAASVILEKVQDDFLERMKDVILSKAATIFNRMTDGEYVKILPPAQLAEMDLRVELANGESQDTVDILSRGTCEQLYLAVRISRILDTKPSLPVIIDDSFVNFDCRHTKESLQIISELSESHQIFVLTCHPEIVEYINGIAKAQYWKLEKGRFSSSDCNELSKYLSS